MHLKEMNNSLPWLKENNPWMDKQSIEPVKACDEMISRILDTLWCRFQGKCALERAIGVARIIVHYGRGPCVCSPELVRLNMYCTGGARLQVQACSGLFRGYLVRAS